MAGSPQRYFQPVGLAADELVVVIGAHRAAEHHRAGVVVQCFGQGVAKRRPADVEIETFFQQHMADTSRARTLLMQHDQDLWLRTRLAWHGKAKILFVARCSGGAGRVRRRLAARLDAIVAFDADQLGDAPDGVVLELVQLAVGIDDFHIRPMKALRASASRWRFRTLVKA